MVQQKERAEIEDWVRAESGLGRARFVTQGCDASEVESILSRIRTVDDWIRVWSASGAEHEERAREAEKKGHTLSAGESYLRASLSYHWGKMRWAGVLDDEEAYHVAHAGSIRAYEHGAALLDESFERVEIPYENITISAHIRRPSGVENPPVVLLVPGMDSVKEEFWQWGSVFIDRGMAVVAFDGPGQGETRDKMPVRHDYETAGKAIIDYLEGRNDLDAARTGAVGVSMGGYYAPRIACFEDRLKAIISISGSFVVRTTPENPGNAANAWWRFIAWAKTPEESAEIHGRRSLEGIIGNIRCPYLVVNGKLDAQSSYVNTEEIVREAEKAGVPVDYVLYEDGSHVCFNIPYKCRPLVGDWMADKLSGNQKGD